MAETELNAPARVLTGQSFDGNEATDLTHADASHFIDSPPAADTTLVQPATTTQPVEEVAANPQVAALQAIFPDFDPIVLSVQLNSFPHRSLS